MESKFEPTTAQDLLTRLRSGDLNTLIEFQHYIEKWAKISRQGLTAGTYLSIAMYELARTDIAATDMDALAYLFNRISALRKKNIHLSESVLNAALTLLLSAGVSATILKKEFSADLQQNLKPLTAEIASEITDEEKDPKPYFTQIHESEQFQQAMETDTGDFYKEKPSNPWTYLFSQLDSERFLLKNDLLEEFISRLNINAHDIQQRAIAERQFAYIAPLLDEFIETLSQLTLHSNDEENDPINVLVVQLCAEMTRYMVEHASLDPARFHATCLEKITLCADTLDETSPQRERLTNLTQILTTTLSPEFANRCTIATNTALVETYLNKLAHEDPQALDDKPLLSPQPFDAQLLLEHLRNGDLWSVVALDRFIGEKYEPLLQKSLDMDKKSPLMIAELVKTDLSDTDLAILSYGIRRLATLREQGIVFSSNIEYFLTTYGMSFNTALVVKTNDASIIDMPPLTADTLPAFLKDSDAKQPSHALFKSIKCHKKAIDTAGQAFDAMLSGPPQNLQSSLGTQPLFIERYILREYLIKTYITLSKTSSPLRDEALQKTAAIRQFEWVEPLLANLIEKISLLTLASSEDPTDVVNVLCVTLLEITVAFLNTQSSNPSESVSLDELCLKEIHTAKENLDANDPRRPLLDALAQAFSPETSLILINQCRVAASFAYAKACIDALNHPVQTLPIDDFIISVNAFHAQSLRQAPQDRPADLAVDALVAAQCTPESLALAQRIAKGLTSFPNDSDLASALEFYLAAGMKATKLEHVSRSTPEELLVIQKKIQAYREGNVAQRCMDRLESGDFQAIEDLTLFVRNKYTQLGIEYGEDQFTDLLLYELIQLNISDKVLNIMQTYLSRSEYLAQQYNPSQDGNFRDPNAQNTYRLYWLSQCAIILQRQDIHQTLPILLSKDNVSDFLSQEPHPFDILSSLNVNERQTPLGGIAPRDIDPFILKNFIYMRFSEKLKAPHTDSELKSLFYSTFAPFNDIFTAITHIHNLAANITPKTHQEKLHAFLLEILEDIANDMAHPTAQTAAGRRAFQEKQTKKINTVWEKWGYLGARLDPLKNVLQKFDGAILIAALREGNIDAIDTFKANIETKYHPKDDKTRQAFYVYELMSADLSREDLEIVQFLMFTLVAEKTDTTDELTTLTSLSPALFSAWILKEKGITFSTYNTLSNSLDELQQAFRRARFNNEILKLQKETANATPSKAMQTAADRCLNQLNFYQRKAAFQTLLAQSGRAIRYARQRQLRTSINTLTPDNIEARLQNLSDEVFIAQYQARLQRSLNYHPSKETSEATQKKIKMLKEIYTCLTSNETNEQKRAKITGYLQDHYQSPDANYTDLWGLLKQENQVHQYRFELIDKPTHSTTQAHIKLLDAAWLKLATRTDSKTPTNTLLGPLFEKNPQYKGSTLNDFMLLLQLEPHLRQYSQLLEKKLEKAPRNGNIKYRKQMINDMLKLITSTSKSLENKLIELKNQYKEFDHYTGAHEQRKTFDESKRKGDVPADTPSPISYKPDRDEMTWIEAIQEIFHTLFRKPGTYTSAATKELAFFKGQYHNICAKANEIPEVKPGEDQSQKISKPGDP